MVRVREGGDTIIEVLLAITVFSLIAVAAITLMNQGTNTTQRSLEVSTVKQQINSQAQALRAAYQEGIASSGKDATWDLIKLKTDEPGINTTTVCPSNYGNSFVLNARAGKTASAEFTKFESSGSPTAPPYAQVIYSDDSSTAAIQKSYGIWIEKTRQAGNGTIPAMYTFKIRACWYGPGSNAPMQLQTVVRLYDAGI